MPKIPRKIAYVIGSKYERKEIQENARCCHCARKFVWNEYDGHVYRGKVLCPDCFDDHYGYCNECGKLNNYDDMNDDIICKGCIGKE